jgi:hypothetical protein
MSPVCCAAVSVVYLRSHGDDELPTSWGTRATVGCIAPQHQNMTRVRELLPLLPSPIAEWHSTSCLQDAVALCRRDAGTSTIMRVLVESLGADVNAHEEARFGNTTRFATSPTE